DFSQYDLDAPIGHIESNAIQSAAETFRKASGDGEEWTVRKLAEWVGVGGFGPVLVGSGATVAEQHIALQDETDIDGVNPAYHITPGTFEDVVEYIVPELQDRGRYKTEYSKSTLRHKLFGRADQLPANQVGASYKLGATALVRRRVTRPDSWATGYYMCKPVLGTSVNRHFESIQNWLAVAQPDEDRSGCGSPTATPHFVSNFFF